MIGVDRWPAVCIHGDKSQPERDHVLQGICLSSSTVTFTAQYWLIDNFCYYCVLIRRARSKYICRKEAVP